MFNECRTIQRSSTWFTPDGQERPRRHWFGRSPSVERVVVHAVDGWPAPTFAGTQIVTTVAPRIWVCPAGTRQGWATRPPPSQMTKPSGGESAGVSPDASEL